VSFRRSLGQYVDLGTPTLAIDHNGGFTLVLYMSLNVTGDAFQQILSLGNSAGAADSLLLGVNPYSSELNASVTIGGTLYSLTAQTIVSGEWALYTVRYRADTQRVEITKDGLIVSSAYLPEIIPDQIQLQNCALGAAADVDISAFYFYDRYLSDSEVAVVSSYVGESLSRYTLYCIVLYYIIFIDV
jgi:hypothetical protein